jgi:uncharacterized damage-inducible protein DinB
MLISLASQFTEENQSMKRVALFLCAALCVGLCVGATSGQEKAAATAAPKASAGIAAEFLQEWNRTGNKLVEMAQDFPEDKLDFKAAATQRTFAEQLLHAAGANYYFIDAATGTTPPGDVENPSRETYKTRAQIAAYIQKVYADGAAVIQKQGDKGMLETVKSPFGNVMLTRASLWTFAIAHANEHYGQCVVYYRVNGLVPPETRNSR